MYCNISQLLQPRVITHVGPLSFVMYMYDLPANVSEIFDFISFAEDTDLWNAIQYPVPISRPNVNETLDSKLTQVH